MRVKSITSSRLFPGFNVAKYIFLLNYIIMQNIKKIYKVYIVLDAAKYIIVNSRSLWISIVYAREYLWAIYTKRRGALGQHSLVVCDINVF